VAGYGCLFSKIIPYVTIVSFALVQILKVRRSHQPQKVKAQQVTELDDFDAESVLEDKGLLKVLQDFGYFWYDFLIGDDLVGFAIVIVALQGTNLLVHGGTNAWWLLPIAVAFLLPINLFRVTRQ